MDAPRITNEDLDRRLYFLEKSFENLDNRVDTISGSIEVNTASTKNIEIKLSELADLFTGNRFIGRMFKITAGIGALVTVTLSTVKGWMNK